MEILKISQFGKTYYARYSGSRSDIFGMLRLLDINHSYGRFIPYDGTGDYTSGYWEFEVSVEFYNFSKTNDFALAMQRCRIGLVIDDVLKGF